MRIGIHQAAAMVAVLGGAAMVLAQEADSARPVLSDQTISVLDAQSTGLAEIVLRGQGADQVKCSIRNTSERRLNIIFPPGLVAAAASGQGFQSMGLGTPTDHPGRFGRFSSNAVAGGFRSVSLNPEPAPDLSLSPGEAADLDLPSVCLNFGAPTPTPRDQFTLTTIEAFSPDPRVHRALKSLAILGTSQPVAQAVMWHVANDMTFSQLASQATRYLNGYDIAAAARFVDTLDSSSTGQIIDLADLQQGRIFILMNAQGTLGKVTDRVRSELDHASLLGLPITAVESLDPLQVRPGTFVLDVELSPGTKGETLARVNARYRTAFGSWNRIANFGTSSAAKLADISGIELAQALDHAMAQNLIRLEPVRRGQGVTTFKVTNRFPLTLGNLHVKAGKAADAPVVTIDAVGIAPLRSGRISVPAANATVQSASLNGL
jgi:hypothetical protein